jgi:hypothetical protein
VLLNLKISPHNPGNFTIVVSSAMFYTVKNPTNIANRPNPVKQMRYLEILYVSKSQKYASFEKNFTEIAQTHLSLAGEFRSKIF